MESFYIVVLAISITSLILLLTLIGVAIRKSNKNVEWPLGEPMSCPDGWEEHATDGKCYIPTNMVNTGKVYLDKTLPNHAENKDKKYTFETDADNAWRNLGTATVTRDTISSPKKATITAISQSNFNYFKVNDKIKLGTDTKEYTIATKPNNTTLTVEGNADADLPAANASGVDYFGKRIVVDFNDTSLYKGADSKATKCLRNKWALANEVQWDGVSNYNGC